MSGERVADAAAVGSFLGWLSSVAVQTLPIVQWLAGIIAIAAGVAAYRYHTAARRKISQVRDDAS